MFVNYLVVLFVTAFSAVVVFGHVLLIAAIWPDPPPVRGESHHKAHEDIARNFLHAE
jgi:hypothetical protein